MTNSLKITINSLDKISISKEFERRSYLLITFTSEKNKRQFNVYDNNFHFLQKLLESDIKTGNRFLLPNDWLSSELATLTALEINSIIKNNTIYEFQSFDVVEPLVNPSIEQVEQLKHYIRPISEKRLNFIDKFVNYLLDNGSFNISSF